MLWSAVILRRNTVKVRIRLQIYTCFFLKQPKRPQAFPLPAGEPAITSLHKVHSALGSHSRKKNHYVKSHINGQHDGQETRKSPSLNFHIKNSEIIFLVVEMFSPLRTVLAHIHRVLLSCICCPEVFKIDRS